MKKYNHFKNYDISSNKNVEENEERSEISNTALLFDSSLINTKNIHIKSKEYK